MTSCPKCKEHKQPEEFYPDKSKKSGLSSYCKDCMKAKARNQSYNKKSADRYRSCISGHLRRITNNARFRAKRDNLVFNIDYHFLLNLWHKQQGKCALSNDPMVVKIGSGSGKATLSPSIDRIDPSEGYTRDNVQLLSVESNRHKSDKTNKEILEWSQKVIDTLMV